MPTYQYACPDCGTEFEKVQKFADEPVKKCPKCGKRKVYRVVSKVAVSFKGSGWYINDSKSNTNGKADNKNGKGDEKDKADEKPETTTTESKAETATESTTESKAEAKTDSKAEVKTETTANKADKTEKKPSKKKAE